MSKFLWSNTKLISSSLFNSTPNKPNWNDPWNMLNGNGTFHYLLMSPRSKLNGRYTWTTDINRGKKNALSYFPHAEGIDVAGNELYFVSKNYSCVYVLDLDSNTYKNISTKHGLFTGQPDQVVHIVGNASNSISNNNTTQRILYFTEDGGRFAGVHGRDVDGQFYTILESRQYADEVTGLAFSPDSKHMYLAYQDNGLLFDITRKDGLSFDGTTLNVKRHASNSTKFAR
jgi:DNA-binding beta-propeller fold protein YncE